jgi:catechol 2,3-dioxygenase-like lactoylglutathione lyase family enzyme
MSEFRVQQIDHVEMFVPDRYEAAKWYRQMLGLEIVSEFEFWADEGGPLMIAAGTTKLALFTGEPRGQHPTAGFHRVAFRVDGPGYVELCRRLGIPHEEADHTKSWSVYFSDPYGHLLEVTTYDYEYVLAHR